MNDIEIRFAELKDVEKIMELYETALEPCSNKAEREFLREKNYPSHTPSFVVYLNCLSWRRFS
jgi:predicted N-acetyltransferase YhbS